MGDSEPKLRHEFVGMMFAVAIGEVGLQTADLVQKGSWLRYLPEYSHLVLCTVIIASSWVGWTLSVAPGARRDVQKIFQWEFLVLLLDVALVIIYFIIVRLVERPPSDIALWIFGIFILYFAWDIVTKIIIYLKEKKENKAEKEIDRPKEGEIACDIVTWDPPTEVTLSFSRKKSQGKKESWPKSYGSRMLPTVVCIGLALWMKYLLTTADRARFLAADVALISLVLLFRALKELVSAVWPTKPAPDLGKKWVRTVLSTSFCTVFLVLGILYARTSWRLPLAQCVVDQIQASPQDAKPFDGR